MPWQLAQGTQLNETGPEATAHTRAIQLQLGDYEHTVFPPASFDAVYALESSCYARSPDKSAFLTEAFRLLRPGGRLVLADGFLSRADAFIGPQHAIYRLLCTCWVIEDIGEIPAVARELHRLGFTDILVEPIQARVTLSVLQVPLVTLKFLIAEVVFGRRQMSPARWNNIIAPVLLPFVGKPIGPMGYYIVSATKPPSRGIAASRSQSSRPASPARPTRFFALALGGLLCALAGAALLRSRAKATRATV